MNKNVFLFSGQGSQYYQMGAELYQNDPGFKKHMDALDKIAQDLIHRSVVDMLYNENNKKNMVFSRTLYTHPAIFMVEYSLARTLMDQEIVPDCLIGASLGEYVCMALARVLPAEEILTLLIRHGRIVEETCEPGSMIGIIEDPGLYESDPVIFKNSTLVGINFDRHFVVSGFRKDLMKISAHLTETGKLFQELPISHGFHSPNIDPAFARCEQTVSPGRIQLPQIDMISCLTGKKQIAVDQSCFWAIARQPILFPQALKTLCQEIPGDYNMIDLGPAGTYAGFTRQNKVLGENSRIYHVMTHFGNGLRNLTKIKHELKAMPGGSAKPVHMKRKVFPMKAVLFPGQGSQRRGMGREMFARFPDRVQAADEILGYSIESLCVTDPENRLNHTRYTQPALFVVNALTYLGALETWGKMPDYAAGHSLGEYNALLAARAIDFQTGLKLVKKRGELMATAQNGGMAAVMGMDEKTIRAIIEQSGCKQVGIANLNTPSQIVISGARSEIDRLGPFFENRKTVRYVILNVSGAFHSRLMDAAGKTYAQFLESFEFCTPQIPVISNVLARPYPPGDEKKLLAQQMTHPVKWVESICYLWGKGVTEFTEMGPGNVLTKMVATIQQEATPLAEATPLEKDAPVDRTLKISAASLGCREYKKDHHLKYAYATGGMAHGIASREMVVKMGKAGMIGYFGANGLSLDEIEQAIVYIQGRLDQGQAYGMNLMAGPGEEEQVALYLKHKVARVEAAAYLQMTPALVRYKLNGLHRNPDGSVLVSNKIMGKLSRPEVAMGFLSPAPPEIVNDLVKQGAVTRDQADLARNIPMADDICVAADSGGHTDMGAASALMPALMRLRNGMMEKYHYAQKIRIGAAGGIGTPEAAAAAFILGADFILTGSINQCTVEAGTSDRVKALLQEMNVQDTAYCPAGDTFEMGSKVQVLKKGVFFPARANKLYELYRHYDAWDKIDKKTRNQLETRYFKCGFEDLYARCKQGFAREEILRAENNPKQKMALVFRWYLNQGHRLALEGAEENRVDFQIYCGPALGAFNQWVKGTELENWQNRHVDEIAEKLLNDTADLLKERFHRFIKPVAP